MAVSRTSNPSNPLSSHLEIHDEKILTGRCDTPASICQPFVSYKCYHIGNYSLCLPPAQCTDERANCHGSKYIVWKLSAVWLTLSLNRFGRREKGMAVWSVPNGHPLFPTPGPIQAIALAKQLIVSNPYTLIHGKSLPALPFCERSHRTEAGTTEQYRRRRPVCPSGRAEEARERGGVVGAVKPTVTVRRIR